MPTYNEVKSQYEQDQTGMQTGLQQAASTGRSTVSAAQARDGDAFVNNAAAGVGTLIGLGIRNARMSAQREKVEKLQAAIEAGYKAIGERRYKDALATASTILIPSDIAEARFWGYLIRGAAYNHLKKYPESIKDFNEAIIGAEKPGVEIDRDTLSTFYFSRGVVHRESSNSSEALRDFTHAIQLNPASEDPYIYRSAILCDIGEYDRAMSDINQAISIQPGDADNYRRRAHIHRLTGAQDLAIENFTRAIALGRSVRNLRERGQFYAEIGRYDAAIADYSAALQIDPQDAETLKLRAEAKRSIGAHSESVADLAHAVDAESQNTAYERYLDAAETVYEQGVTKVWTQKDASAKPNYFTALGLGVLTLIGTFLGLIFFSGGSPLGVLLALIIPFLAAGAVTWSRINEPRQRARNAQQYFNAMSAQETLLPAFTNFFTAYLNARDNAELAKLHDVTRYLFAPNGAASAYTTRGLHQ